MSDSKETFDNNLPFSTTSGVNFFIGCSKDVRPGPCSECSRLGIGCQGRGYALPEWTRDDGLLRWCKSVLSKQIALYRKPQQEYEARTLLSLFVDALNRDGLTVLSRPHSYDNLVPTGSGNPAFHPSMKASGADLDPIAFLNFWTRTRGVPVVNGVIQYIQSQLGITASDFRARPADSACSSRQSQPSAMPNPLDVEDLGVPRRPSGRGRLVSQVPANTQYFAINDSRSNDFNMPSTSHNQLPLSNQALINPYPNHIVTGGPTPPLSNQALIDPYPSYVVAGVSGAPTPPLPNQALMDPHPNYVATGVSGARTPSLSNQALMDPYPIHGGAEVWGAPTPFLSEQALMNPYQNHVGAEVWGSPTPFPPEQVLMDPYPNSVVAGVSDAPTPSLGTMDPRQEYSIAGNYQDWRVNVSTPGPVQQDRIPVRSSLHQPLQCFRTSLPTELPGLRRVILEFNDQAEDSQRALHHVFGNFNMLRTNPRGRHIVFVVNGGSLVPETPF